MIRAILILLFCFSDIESASPAVHPILAPLQKHLSRVAPHPGLRPRIRRDPTDLLSVMEPSIGYPAGIADIECTLQDRYKLYCMYTPQFETLFEQYFLPSLKDDFEVDVSVYPQDCPTGRFRSDGWEKTMLYKLEMLERAIIEHWGGKIFFYSDIDIIFLKPILEACLTYLDDNDFVVQEGWPKNNLCAGFFVMRGNEKTLNLITTAHKLLQDKICIDDQVAIQTALNYFRQEKIKWKLLPSNQFPNGRRVLKSNVLLYSEDSEIQLDDSILLFHANCCIGLENKYHFLKRVQELFLKN